MAKASWSEIVAAAAAGGNAGLNSTRQRQAGSATVTNPDGSTSQVDIYTKGPTEEQEQQRRANKQAEARAADRAAHNQQITNAALFSTTVGGARTGTVR